MTCLLHYRLYLSLGAVMCHALDYIALFSGGGQFAFFSCFVMPLPLQETQDFAR